MVDLKFGMRNISILELVYVRYFINIDFLVDMVVRYVLKVFFVKIFFVLDINFDYKNKLKVVEKVKRLNYYFRFVFEKRRNLLKF